MAIEFLVHLERFELSCLSAQPPQGCVYTSSTTDAFSWLPVRVTLSVGLSTSDLQSLLALYETTRQIKEDALAVDCSALM